MEYIYATIGLMATWALLGIAIHLGSIAKNLRGLYESHHHTCDRLLRCCERDGIKVEMTDDMRRRGIL